MPKSAVAVRAGAAWLVILACAIANGAFREAVLVPYLGDPWALIVSGVILSACVAAVAFFLVGTMEPTGTRQYLLIGVFWLCLTLLFEFGFGRAVQRKPWPEIFGAYRFENGNLWPFVLLVILFAPWVSARLRHMGSRGRQAL